MDGPDHQEVLQDILQENLDGEVELSWRYAEVGGLHCKGWTVLEHLEG